MTVQTFQLNDNTEIPWLAWGNGTGNAKKQALDAGIAALKAGITHLDTAQIYTTEPQTKEAIEQTKTPRSSVYVTSKIGNAFHTDKEIRQSIEESIEKLGGPPDLFLIHNPFPDTPEVVVPTWKVMEQMKDEGKLKSLGVSNFRPQDWDLLLPECRYKPAVHQFEFHPFVLAHSEPILAIHKKHNIVAESYGPLTASMRAPKETELNPVLERISKRLSKESGEEVDLHAVQLFWCKAKGVVAVTASANEKRIKVLGKLAHLDLHLTPEEVAEIDEIGKKYHYRHYSEHIQNVEKTMPLPDIPAENILKSSR